MTKGSDNEFPSVLFDEQGSAPTTPSTGFWRLYTKSDGLYIVDDAGTETGPLGTGSGSPTFVGARGKRSSASSISDSTWTALGFNAEDFDTDAFHDNSTNPSRFTIPSGKAGKYLVVAQELWASNGTGNRLRAIAKNGSRIVHTAGDGLTINGLSYGISDIVDCAVSDYLELHVYQSSGGSLDIQTGAYMAITYLG